MRAVSVRVTSGNCDGSDGRRVPGAGGGRPPCDIAHAAAVNADNSVHRVGYSLIQTRESAATPNRAPGKVPEWQECDFFMRRRQNSGKPQLREGHLTDMGHPAKLELSVYKPRFLYDCISPLCFQRKVTTA